MPVQLIPGLVHSTELQSATQDELMLLPTTVSSKQDFPTNNYPIHQIIM